ncbi:MAG: hypothetical protein HFI34_12580 [Lachnospiraceae bacterium]|nr:hypothetical protein [Lachnospiraceae bacterium]
MNFKDSYKNDMDKIGPDREFIRNLNTSLQAVSGRPQKTVKFFRHGIVSAVVLLMIFTVGSGLALWYSGRKSGGGAPNLDQQGNMESSVSVGETVFDKQKWFENCDTEQDIYNLFIRRISDENDLVKIYKNNEEKFDNSMLMGQKEIDSLTYMLQRGRIGDERGVNTENIKAEYYMAVFENGDIIKFSIYESNALKLKEFDFLIFL